MDTAGERLAAAQLDGHKAIDTLYAPLAADLEELVLRYAAPDQNGVLRLSLPARAAILRQLGTRLDVLRPDLFAVVRDAMKAAVVEAQVDVAPLPAFETASLAPAGQIALSLGSDRPSVIGQSGLLLLRGVVQQLPAREVAKHVRQYFSPWFSQYRDASGKLLHTDRVGAIARWPGQAGMASQHVRLVMLDATSSVHFRTTQRLAVRDDDLLRYHVSHKHLEIDECDRLERQDIGYGPGVYPPDQFPTLPRHRRCRCWAEMADRPRFLTLSESVPA